MKLFPKLLLLVCIVSAISVAKAVEYGTVQADKSALTFISHQMGVPVKGRFSKFTTRITFDSGKPEAAKVDINVDLASIDAGSKDANDEVVGKQWFNVLLFPAASFTSSSVKLLGAGRFEVTGPLSIKGKSIPVTATFSFKTEGANAVFDGSFILKRTNFGIGEGPWADLSTVANEIQVNFYFVAAPSAAISPKKK